jgi:glycosyltransferase involved in cell wall biosynthesis
MTANHAGLRLLHVCPRYAPAPGGVELFFSKLSATLAARGHQVSVWTTNARELRAFSTRQAATFPAGGSVIDGVAVRRYAVRHVPFRPWLMTAAHILPFGPSWARATFRWNPIVPSLVREARTLKARFDIVHGAALPYSVLLDAARLAAASASARLVISPFLHLDNPADPKKRVSRIYLSPTNVALLRQADLVLVQTTVEQSTLADAGVPTDRMRLVGMGVDEADCTGGDRARGRARWNLPPTEVVVGHLANKSVDKGTVDLLHASGGLRADGLSFRLLLAGTAMPSYERVWQHFEPKDHVVNVGELDDVEKRDFFSAIDLFVLPSCVESFGIALLEAAVNRVPSIAYDLGGPREILNHDRTGVLVPPGDVPALQRQIRRLIEDRQLRQRIGDAAAVMALSGSWARTTQMVEDAYRSLVRA